MVTVKALKNSGQKRTKKESRWNNVTKVLEAGLHTREESFVAEKVAKKVKRERMILLTEAVERPCRMEIFDVVDSLQERKIL